MKQNIMDGYNIGDTMFDPLEKKRKHKETVPEMEFLSKLGEKRLTINYLVCQIASSNVNA